MTLLRSMCVVFLVGFSACEGARDDVATVEQAATTPPFLLEIAGVSSGSIQSIKATSGTGLCGVSGLELSLGANFGTATTSWLNETLAGKQAIRSGAIYVGAQRVAFTGVLTKIDLPQLDLQSTAPVFFTIGMNTSPTSCTTVSTSAMNQKTALAAGWAKRQLQANGFKAQIGKAVVGQPSGTGRASGRLSFGDFTAEFNVSEADKIWALIDDIMRDKQVQEFEMSLVLSDVGGTPFGRFASNGPASVLTAAQKATFTLSNIQFTPASADGGVP